MDTEAEKYLRELDGDGGKNWVVIGHVLSELEKHSRSSTSGQAWQDVVKERLAAAGSAVSAGHMYKIRRAYKFLEEQEVDALHLNVVPKISAIEVSERLFRLDAESGREALSDALAEVPIAYVDLKKRYESVLESKPEMKSPRQLAWEARRSSDKTPEKTAAAVAVGHGQEGEGVSREAEGVGAPSLPDELLKSAQNHTQMVWVAGWRAAEQHFRSEIESLRGQIEEQMREKSVFEQTLTDYEGEMEVLTRMVRDLRGDFDE
ncbi:hypothetical protein JQX09_23540 [Sulfitobacter pseudonitzschiae]|uniref:Uncharacterized protein n=1 Tax=Pseudosulfitobacter pseudonitzschiae TaxID=1402135 RepID=A0A9Q2NTK5_9RHOB|nr:hypothetical protein [Pseudosulfitobacter pseudonitzschiae]MBM2294906.1 hypothetical protein [Pseudosulfitobacter pseudonitzschiae]MBM2299822.1 hypothetical protein [Pseudosulfitobacter pseudonitzschiae]MBM2304743.1 hypothetical protein [Pseudosulfitobacter pseudonitzschiae]MBM2314517.1 hypothetical protein [Pseudosulfitobacter pseudonitzschiae]MBM2319427.1 hypothetical protein [Pseudosulfitobacter pseudonitzschiae]